jgi:hypothetical protein
MALQERRRKRARTTGHVSREAQVRVDARVAQILARRDTALRQARLAARRLRRP